MNTKEGIVEHHSDYPHDGTPQLMKVNKWHRDRGFPLSKLGFYVGYHFFIEESGTITQTRDLNEVGAHAVNCGHACKADVSGFEYSQANWRTIGICLAGDFTKHEPTEKQIVALHTLIIDLQWNYGIPNTKIYLHSQLKPTSCPGVNLTALVEKEHLVYLEKRYEKAVNALRWADDGRSKMLLRLIKRILSIISPQPV